MSSNLIVLFLYTKQSLSIKDAILFLMNKNALDNEDNSLNNINELFFYAHRLQTLAIDIINLLSSRHV